MDILLDGIHYLIIVPATQLLYAINVSIVFVATLIVSIATSFGADPLAAETLGLVIARVLIVAVLMAVVLVLNELYERFYAPDKEKAWNLLWWTGFSPRTLPLVVQLEKRLQRIEQRLAAVEPGLDDNDDDRTTEKKTKTE